MAAETDMAEHTFNLSKMNGEGYSFAVLAQPPPTVSSLRVHLHEEDKQLQLLLGNKILLEDHEFKDLKAGESTDLMGIFEDGIEITEAGLYNGRYGKMENSGRPVMSHGFPVYKMIESYAGKDNSRYVFYDNDGRAPSGWKFSKSFCGSSWDMLSPYGPRGSSSSGSEIPEGKFVLDNGGTGVKANAPLVSHFVKEKYRRPPELMRTKSLTEEQENIDTTECGGCFNGEAMVEMADGTLSKASDIRVGDLLASGPGGGTTMVEGITVEIPAVSQTLVQLGNLLITPHHPVISSGRWIYPLSLEGAKYVDARIELYNFVTSHRMPICLEGFVCTSVGTFCDGLHDIEGNLEHRIWGTDLIVKIFQQHPQWPYVRSTSAETVDAVHRAKSGMSASLW